MRAKISLWSTLFFFMTNFNFSSHLICVFTSGSWSFFSLMYFQTRFRASCLVNFFLPQMAARAGDNFLGLKIISRLTPSGPTDFLVQTTPLALAYSCSAFCNARAFDDFSALLDVESFFDVSMFSLDLGNDVVVVFFSPLFKEFLLGLTTNAKYIIFNSNKIYFKNTDILFVT